jgi:uncharacterized ion transporter superfamily protein YfcC
MKKSPHVYAILFLMVLVAFVVTNVVAAKRQRDMEQAEAQRQFEVVMQKMDEYIAAAKACKFGP